MENKLLNFLTSHEERFRKGRLGALYSDFRHLRTTNPDGYSANISAWQKALTDATREGYISSRGNKIDLFILPVSSDLLSALETKEWGRPLSLGAVINDLIIKKELIPLQEFLDSKESIYQRPRVVTQIFYWSLRQLGFSGGSGQDEEDKLPAGKFVVLANIDTAMKEVSNRIATKTSRVERIYSKDLFLQEFSSCLRHPNHFSPTLSPTDLDILLKYLARDKHLIAYDGQTIKVLNSSGKDSPQITNEDTAIASLKTLITDLRLQNETLENRIDWLSKAAREAVANKNTLGARSSLRSKKLATTTLSKRTATLAQLEEVYTSIEQAADQVEFMHVMEISTGVLRGLNAEVGGVERVDKVVEQLREQMDVVGEVGNVINEVGQGSGVVDEEELSGELEAMEREERERREFYERAEREKKEAVERDERERKEVEETRRRLGELEKVGGEGVVSDGGGDGGLGKENEKPIEEARDGLKRMSLEVVPS